MNEPAIVLQRQRGSPFQNTIILCSQHSLERLGHHLRSNPHCPEKVLRMLMRDPGIQFVAVLECTPLTEKWRVGCFEIVVIRNANCLFSMEVVKVKTCWRVVRQRRPRYRDARAKEKRELRRHLSEL